MIDTSLIRKEMEAQQVSVYQLYKMTGISQPTLHNILNRNDMKVSHFISICDALSLDYSKLIPSVSVNGDSNTTISSGRDASISGGSGVDATCEKLLAEKERVIEEKERMIQAYKEMLDMLKAGRG